MRKVGLVIIVIAIIFSVYQPHSRSLSVLDVERVGDRLLSDEEYRRILAASEPMSLSTDIVYRAEPYGVKQRAGRYVITDQAGVIYYSAKDGISLLGCLADEWLISRRLADGLEVIAFDPHQRRERVIAELVGAEIGDSLVWQEAIYFEGSSPYKGEVIYRYLPDQPQLHVFVANGFEPKIHRDRLHYLYRKGDAIGFESISADGLSRQSFALEQASIYSYLFRDDKVDLLTTAHHADGWYFLRIQDAFEAAEIEKFELFDARFQTERLVFGTNGIRDSLLIDNTLVHLPKEMHFRRMIGPDVYYVDREQHYRIKLSSLESILSSNY